MRSTELFSTYSIVAHDPLTDQVGVAVQTHQMGVGRLVPWVLPGVGAVATQSLVNVSFGPMALAMLKEGVEAQQVVDALVASDPMAHRRQVAVVDADGNVGAYTGEGCIAHAGHHIGDGYSVQANMMTNDTVIHAMAQAYENTPGDLAAKMMAALYAAQAQDGDIRGMQSAALVIVSGDINDADWQTVYDLRVDEHDTPVDELARLVRLRSAQLLDGKGHQQLSAGSREAALDLWAQARTQAPELEELAFWQAVTLADEHNDLETADAILEPVLLNHERRDHWIDLIQRLIDTGLIENPDRGQALIDGLT